MTDEPPRMFAMQMINNTKITLDNLSTNPDGTPRGHDAAQATAIGQVQALTALAASVLAVAEEMWLARKNGSCR